MKRRLIETSGQLAEIAEQLQAPDAGLAFDQVVERVWDRRRKPCPLPGRGGQLTLAGEQQALAKHSPDPNDRSPRPVSRPPGSHTTI